MTDDAANDLYDKAISLSKRFDERFLELARTLRKLRTNDPELFRVCVKESQISLRTAYYLLEVEETYRKLAVPDKRLQAIGWTKLQVMAKHVTKHNIGEALKLAEQVRTRDLKVLMKGEWPEDKPHCVLMYMTEAQYAVFKGMVLDFGAKRGLKGLADKEKVLTEFIEFHYELVEFLKQELADEGAK